MDQLLKATWKRAGNVSIGNRSSRPRVMSPVTWVTLPEILVMSPEKKKVKLPEETNTKKIRISDC